MKSKWKFLIVLLLFIICVVAWFLWPQPLGDSADEATSRINMSESPTEAGKPEKHSSNNSDQSIHRRPQDLDSVIRGVYGAPVDFYGKVVDLDGDPVPYAEIRYALADNFMASGSGGRTIADHEGKVVILEKRGATITVWALKDGYEDVLDFADGTYAYGVGPDSHVRPRPTKENPAVLILRKKADSEPMIHRGRRSILTRKDGTPVEISLSHRKTVPSGQGDIIVQMWTEDTEPNESGRFDWRYRISVPGGGLVERTNPLLYEAPASGYTEFEEFSMVRADANYVRRHERQMFIRNRMGHYARIDLTVIPGGGHFVAIETWLNPSGARNLEYDEAKRIKP